MKVKYNLPTGKVVLLDIEDILAIDSSTPEGIEAMQTIINSVDNTKTWDDFDDAILNDSPRYSEKDIILPEEPEEDSEDFEP